MHFHILPWVTYGHKWNYFRGLTGFFWEDWRFWFLKCEESEDIIFWQSEEIKTEDFSKISTYEDWRMKNSTECED